MSGSHSFMLDSSKFTTIKTMESQKFEIQLVKCLSTSENFVLKTFSPDKDYSHYLFKREKKLHSTLSHPNIIQYIQDQSLDKKTSDKVILMEHAPYGDFFTLLTSCNIRNEQIARTFFHHLIDGLEYLHSKKIAHLDLKIENLLLGKNFALKISDFDLSQNFNEERLVSNGTANYRAPEILDGTCKNFQAADIYAAGICLYILMTGTFPFAEDEGANSKSLYRYDQFMLQNEAFWEDNELILENQIEFSPSFKELINQMFAQDPSQRITLEGIKQSPWYNEQIYSHQELKSKMRELIF